MNRRPAMGEGRKEGLGGQSGEPQVSIKGGGGGSAKVRPTREEREE